MFAPREMLLNAAMALPPVRAVARRRHLTGISSDPDGARRRFGELTRDLPADLAGLSVLEVGVGRGVEFIRLAAPRCASYATFDVAPYLRPEDLAGLDVDHRVAADGRLPWPDGSFDLVWSASVLEHVRDPRSLLAEVHRVLVPDGLHVADVDLETHGGDRYRPEEMFGFLRYRESTWRRMSSHRAIYVNRLRASDWDRLFDEAGFDVLAARRLPARCDVAELRALPYLAPYSDADLDTRRLTATMRRRPTAPT